MATEWHETKSEYTRRMSDDGLGDLADQAQVDQSISDSFDELGSVATVVGDIPSTASIRPSGSFTDAESAKEYLDRGGLLVVDGSGDVEPIGFVWFLKEFDEVLEQYTWTVFIDDDTG